MKCLKLITAALLSCLLFVLPVCAQKEICKHVDNTKKQIALTFDDGPHPGRTPEILDILKEFQVKATFFAVGENVRAYPQLIIRELEEGHEIGNHTYSHKTLKSCDEKVMKSEISAFEDIMLEVCEYRPKLIRPPGGLYNECFTKYANSNYYKIVLWSVDTLDWSHPSVDSIVNKVLGNTKSGDIILMHDYIAGKSPTPAALRKIIPALQEKGFQFVTVTELMQNAPEK